MTAQLNIRERLNARYAHISERQRLLWFAAVEHMERNGYWATFHALVEDGPDEKTDYQSLIDGPLPANEGLNPKGMPRYF